MQIHAAYALLPDGWQANLRLTCQDSIITEVAANTPAQAGDQRQAYLLPGLGNLHSHAFQRGFAGLTEHRSAARDSFWTWREMMYRFALTLDPDEMQAIAAMAYVEMLEAGFTRVGEFHYLHHAPDGRAYADPAEMTSRIFAAAAQTGIAVTHLPVFYAHGGFGPSPAGPGQRRFLHDLDGYHRLVHAADGMARRQDRVGIAPHSLRAASLTEISALCRAFPDRAIHIHIAEQAQEVADCLAFAQARPVEHLFNHVEVERNWCLIHATHINPQERQAIVQSGAVAGLCPITEANLGDGLFPAETFLAAGGNLGIGSDSNVEISLTGELKLLEYGQRLAGQGRNLCTVQGSTGTALFQQAHRGGAQALAADARGITPGAPADLVALTDPMQLADGTDQLLDRWIFGRDIRVDSVWAAGQPVVQQGRHRARSQIETAYAQVLRRVLDRS